MDDRREANSNEPSLIRRGFDLSELDYDLPPDRIASYPLALRSQAKLLVVNRRRGELTDRTVEDLPELLQAGDLLILNNTRVIPARFEAYRQTGGLLRGLFLREEGLGIWVVLLESSRRLRVGEALSLKERNNTVAELELLESQGEGKWRGLVRPNLGAEALLARIGRTPLPPYIRRPKGASADEDRESYQTVYARVPGAVAAPTAGLHFTPQLLDRLVSRGIEIAYLTLHVGLGTFKPIIADSVYEHRMHSEPYELSSATMSALRRCRERGGRVIAVGTTTVRALESAAATGRPDDTNGQRGETDLFIYPPFEFKAVDALMTNFHLPRSTLLALVMAFAGTELTQAAYRHAIQSGYRFYSYGDAMLIV